LAGILSIIESIDSPITINPMNSLVSKPFTWSF
jgi:hypothetical protein